MYLQHSLSKDLSSNAAHKPRAETSDEAFHSSFSQPSCERLDPKQQGFTMLELVLSMGCQTPGRGEEEGAEAIEALQALMWVCTDPPQTPVD